MQPGCGCDRKLLACLSPRSAVGGKDIQSFSAMSLQGVWGACVCTPARIFPATQEDWVLPGFTLSSCVPRNGTQVRLVKFDIHLFP